MRFGGVSDFAYRAPFARDTASGSAYGALRAHTASQTLL